MSCELCNIEVQADYYEERLGKFKFMPNYWVQVGDREVYFCGASCSSDWYRIVDRYA